MVRPTPTSFQNLLSSVVLPCLSVGLLPVSFLAVSACVLLTALRRKDESPKMVKGCVLISGGRMSKGLTLARAFKRAGWYVVGVEEEGWGELCPMRFSRAVDHFYILPASSTSYAPYAAKLLEIAKTHSVDMFIPVSGAGSSIEDARAAVDMFEATKGKCRTIIQDPETMMDLHDKDRFMALVHRLGMVIPKGKMVESVDEAIEFLRDADQPTYVLKCMNLDENRGDMTLWPLSGDSGKLARSRKALNEMPTAISKACPFVFQEYIRGQEWCTHASVVDGRITSFVACPSNDMLMTYEDQTLSSIGRKAEEWTTTLLARLDQDLTPSGKKRSLTGHFSFDFIHSSTDDQLYPLECNARVHTAVILLPVSQIASCYSKEAAGTLRPSPGSLPRSWIYNDLVMRYLPLLVPSRQLLSLLHPSLPECLIDRGRRLQPNEEPLLRRVDPTLVADDWLPFIILWHVWWPYLLLTRWWQGKKWTRLNVSTGRIFEA